MTDTLDIGDVVVNDMRQYAKVISFKNGIYGFSGWTTLENAQKATIVNKFLNSYGVKNANLRLVSGATKVSAPAKANVAKGKGKGKSK